MHFFHMNKDLIVNKGMKKKFFEFFIKTSCIFSKKALFSYQEVLLDHGVINSYNLILNN